MINDKVLQIKYYRQGDRTSDYKLQGQNNKGKTFKGKI